jgi:hypothetical protein
MGLGWRYGQLDRRGTGDGVDAEWKTEDDDHDVGGQGRPQEEPDEADVDDDEYYRMYARHAASSSTASSSTSYSASVIMDGIPRTITITRRPAPPVERSRVWTGGVLTCMTCGNQGYSVVCCACYPAGDEEIGP